MKHALTTLVLVLALAACSAPPAAADCPSDSPLRILLTNDDGYDSPGIGALRAALVACGHDVVVVAPLGNQSGAGGSFSTAVGSTVAVVEQSPGVWSVASTPSDAVRAALGVVMAGDPPDLIVSGLNFGQNLGQPGSNASGTVGAALTGLYEGHPAIAASVGLLLSEAEATPIPFPSTFAAFPQAADFVVRVVDQLQRTAKKGGLLPQHTMLNINFPVPYDSIEGVESTQLGQQSDLRFFWAPAGPGLARILVAPVPGPDPVAMADTDAYREHRISITTMDGDMTAPTSERTRVRVRLMKLEP